MWRNPYEWGEFVGILINVRLVHGCCVSGTVEELLPVGLVTPPCLQLPGFSPLRRRWEQIQPDSEVIPRQKLTVHHSRLRLEVALERSKQHALLRLPALLGHDAGTMRTNIFGEGFLRRRWSLNGRKLHSHGPCDSSFGSRGRRMNPALDFSSSRGQRPQSRFGLHASPLLLDEMRLWLVATSTDRADAFEGQYGIHRKWVSGL